ncbi:protein of unknown function [Brevundimonas viscosa]|uniref:DUF1206 domain-containing protein n=1 Tax=Brevundimonas viscosa TaxID=871741 RepID=A0A1I6NUK0_9CAUL|nr:protein of unknown function [Brevundimonas viscosa]
MPVSLARLIPRLPGQAGRTRRRAAREALEWVARIGYGARGFVYLSAGILTLLAVLDRMDGAAGAREALAWLSQQPFGRAWLLLAGCGLLAFVLWRGLQSIFDADHEGKDWHGVNTRLSQAFSGLGYAFLAFSAFRLLLHPPADPMAEQAMSGRERAEQLLSLPLGNWLLVGVGLCIAGVGVANVVKAWRDDFTEYLACSAKLCRRVAPLARAGYMARGLAWLPLAALVVLAGLHARPADVTSFGAALDAVERQPAGAWFLVPAALGFMAFGAFSFVEARFRRIRPPPEVLPS